MRNMQIVMEQVRQALRFVGDGGYEFEFPDLEHYKRAAQTKDSVVEDDGTKPQVYKFNQHGDYANGIAGSKLSGSECRLFTIMLSIFHAKNEKLFWALLAEEADAQIMHDMAEPMILLGDEIVTALKGEARDIAQKYGDFRTLLVKRIYDNPKDTSKEIEAIADIMRAHNISEDIIKELTYGISEQGFRDILTQEQSTAPQDNNEEFQRACQRAEKRAKANRLLYAHKIVAAIDQHGATQALDDYLGEIAPCLMKEDINRKQVYVDDFMPKYWYLQENGALDVFVNSLRSGNMVNILLSNNTGQGPRTGSRAHWVSMGIIKDKNGKDKFAFFDPMDGLHLCSNKAQVKARFLSRVGPYIQDNCIAFVVNHAVTYDFMQVSACKTKIEHLMAAASQVAEAGPLSHDDNAEQAPASAAPPEAGNAPKHGLWHSFFNTLASIFAKLLSVITFGRFKPHTDEMRHNEGGRRATHSQNIAKHTTADKSPQPVTIDGQPEIEQNESSGHELHTTLSATDASNASRGPQIGV